jgi:hypothetical protein
MLAMKHDDDPSIIRLIAETPAVKKALRERDAAVTAKRVKLIGELRQLEAEAEIETPKLAADVERPTADVQKAEAALRGAQQRLATALAARQSFGFDFGRRHDELEAALRASASPLIASFVAEMRDAWTKTRRAPLTQETATTATKSAATGRTATFLKTNAAAVALRLRSINETIAAAEDLATTVANQAEIGSLLGALAERLPQI